MDEDDRQLIDRTLGEATSTEQSSVNPSPHSDKAQAGPSSSQSSGARRSLTDLMAGYDPDLLPL